MIIIFWEMTPCGSYKNRRFGGSYRLHLQGERDEQVQNETVSSCIDGDSGNTTPSVVEPHGVISQKMIIIIVTAVETSNLTNTFALERGISIFGKNFAVQRLSESMNYPHGH
jgi:hypothetical protein